MIHFFIRGGQIVPPPFVAKTTFAPLSKIIWLHSCKSVSRLSVLFIDIFVLSPVHAVLITVALQSVLRSCSVSSPILFFSFNVELAILGFLPPYKL